MDSLISRKVNFNFLKYYILPKRVLFNIIRYNTCIALIDSKNSFMLNVLDIIL